MRDTGETYLYRLCHGTAVAECQRYLEEKKMTNSGQLVTTLNKELKARESLCQILNNRSLSVI